MATLGELPEKERRELARTLAREIWLGVEHDGELPITLEEGVANLLERSGLLHESNFYAGAPNKEAQVAKLKEFHDLRDKLCDYAEQYDTLVASLEQDIPGFVRKSEELRRTYLTVHIMRELCKTDSPFATLRVADAIDDQDRSDESNDDNDDDDDDDDYNENSDESGDEGESDESDETEESDSESNKVLDKADEAEASDSGSGSESGSEDPPPKRNKSERAAAASAAAAAERSPSPECAGDDSDVSDA
jgi:hypothetical protein